VLNLVPGAVKLDGVDGLPNGFFRYALGSRDFRDALSEFVVSVVPPERDFGCRA